MKAVFQTRYGGSDVLQYGALPSPRLGARQVRVAMAATSVNPRDWLIRSGRYQLQFLVPTFPLVLGSDVAGTVCELGSAVTRFRLGDAVMGMKNPKAGLGCHATEVVIDETALVQKPAALSFTEAGGLPLCGLTAWQALVGHGRLKAGQDVLVIGASGGVGTFAVQVATALGARVTGVCSAANRDLVSELGALGVADYRDPNYREALGTFDLVFDTIGRDDLSTCRRLLRPGGRLVSTIPNAPNLVNSVFTATIGRFLGRKPQMRVVMVEPRRPDLEALAHLANSGRLRTVIDRCYPLSEAARAHELSRSRHARGKVILTTLDGTA